MRPKNGIDWGAARPSSSNYERSSLLSFWNDANCRSNHFFFVCRRSLTLQKTIIASSDINNITQLIDNEIIISESEHIGDNLIKDGTKNERNALILGSTYLLNSYSSTEHIDCRGILFLDKF